MDGLPAHLEIPWLLVASPSLVDENFRKSVVLIVEHSDLGSMGFVVNSLSDYSLSELIQVPKCKIPKETPAWFGGPVKTNTGIVLYEGKTNEEDLAIGSGVMLSSSEVTLKNMLRNGIGVRCENNKPLYRNSLYPFRFLIGYAGWGPQQLEQEIKKGAWLPMPMNRELLFNHRWQDMWDMGMASLGIGPQVFAPTEHSYLN